jgi:hypothetical protein
MLFVEMRPHLYRRQSKSHGKRNAVSKPIY